MRVAIVEDERENQAQICSFLIRYEEEHQISVSLTCYEDGIDLAEDFKNQYDIVFCDIMMNHMDGMATAEYIRERDSQVIIIFITNLAEYAIRGYDVSAIGYLLKPINYNLFSRYLDKALNIISQKEPTCLIVKEKRGYGNLCLAIYAILLMKTTMFICIWSTGLSGYIFL